MANQNQESRKRMRIIGHDVVVTRKSVTGISGRQKSVETSRFGSMLDPNWLQLFLLVDLSMD
jgi:hypothetical protein